MNVPERYTSIRLDEESDEKKIEKFDDTKQPNTSTFRLNKEDHTAANLYRTQLLRDDRIIFGGYIHEHPLHNHVQVRVQTKDREYTPHMSMVFATQALKGEFEDLREQFSNQVDIHKGDGNY